MWLHSSLKIHLFLNSLNPVHPSSSLAVFCQTVWLWSSLLTCAASLPCRFYFSGFHGIDVAFSAYTHAHTHTHRLTLSISKCFNQYIPSFLSEPPRHPSFPLAVRFDWIYAVHAAWSWWSWQLWFLSQWISFASQQPPPHCYPQTHPPPPCKCSGLWLTPTHSLTHSVEAHSRFPVGSGSLDGVHFSKGALMRADVHGKMDAGNQGGNVRLSIYDFQRLKVGLRLRKHIRVYVCWNEQAFTVFGIVALHTILSQG